MISRHSNYWRAIGKWFVFIYPIFVIGFMVGFIIESVGRELSQTLSWLVISGLAYQLVGSIGAAGIIASMLALVVDPKSDRLY